MKDEIKDKIIEIYEKLLKIDDDIITVNSSLSYVDSFSTNAIKLENERDFLYEKFKDLKSELASLKSQLSKAGEEKPIIKKCRQCMFSDLDEHCKMLPYCIFKLAAPLKG